MLAMLNLNRGGNKMFNDNFVELNEYIEQIDEAKKNKKKGSKFTEEELEAAQEFVDSLDNIVE